MDNYVVKDTVTGGMWGPFIGYEEAVQFKKDWCDWAYAPHGDLVTVKLTPYKDFDFNSNEIYGV